MSSSDTVHSVFTFQTLNAAVWGFASSFAICVLLVLTKRWHGALTLDHTEGVQKFHTAPTPRIGGAPILLGLIVAWSKAPLEIKELMTPILLAGLPAFIFGLLEDITKRVSVLMRLVATMISGLLAWWITDYSLSRVDIWGVDWLLQFTLISVLFTSFAVGGVANSINIIDGFNGLSSTTSSLIFLGFAIVAAEIGDKQLAGAALILAACVWGFFWVNWPFGKIFLGDGGAYFVGFGLAWVAVMLIERNQVVSAFAALLLCIHPVTEVLFSMYRRQVRKEHPGMPDRLHFHSLVKRRYVSRWFAHFSARARNSITGVAVGLMTLAPVIVVSQTYHSSILTQLACVSFVVGYISLYARMVKHYWCSPIHFLVTNQLAKKRLKP